MLKTVDTEPQPSVALAPEHAPALDRCYGRIGISAVAAAMRYTGAAINPAYAHSPVTPRLVARLDELATA